MMQLPKTLLFHLILAAVGANPYYLLTSTNAKCFQVDVPRLTNIFVEYAVPDLVTDLDLESNLEDLDEQRRKKIESIRKGGSSLKDTNILVIQRVKTGLIASPQWGAHNIDGIDDPPGQKASGRVREQLQSRTGRIEFKTGSQDGYVEICIQSMSASKEAPSRVGLRVYKKSPELGLSDPSSVIDADFRKLTEHSSLISEDLSRMLSRVDQIIIEAEYSKDREKEFRETSIRLNRAVNYWPMFRLVLLLVSGYVQATYVIQYMKSRHIY